MYNGPARSIAGGLKRYHCDQILVIHLSFLRLRFALESTHSHDLGADGRWLRIQTMLQITSYLPGRARNRLH